jgi:hypothetical protein
MLQGHSTNEGTRSKRREPTRSLPVATMLGPPFWSSVVDKEAVHGLGGGEEMSPAAPELLSGRRRILACNQAEMGFVNQGRGLESLARLLLGQPLSCQLAQLSALPSPKATGSGPPNVCRNDTDAAQ